MGPRGGGRRPGRGALGWGRGSPPCSPGLDSSPLAYTRPGSEQEAGCWSLSLCACEMGERREDGARRACRLGLGAGRGVLPLRNSAQSQAPAGQTYFMARAAAEDGLASRLRDCQGPTQSRGGRGPPALPTGLCGSPARPFASESSPAASALRRQASVPVTQTPRHPLSAPLQKQSADL